MIYFVVYCFGFNCFFKNNLYLEIFCLIDQQMMGSANCGVTDEVRGTQTEHPADS